MEKVLKRIYFNEFNVPMNNAVYLPYVSGLLRAYVEYRIVPDYEFAPFIYKREPIEDILKKYDDPYLAAFSVSMWNEQISLAVATEVKKRWPKCKIVFGGCQVESKKNKYISEHPFIDEVINGYGEHKFLELLVEEVNLTQGEIVSPYTLGYFDQIIKDNPEVNFQAIIETNRGCPFSCSYCYWGKGEDKKYKLFSLETIRQVVEWCGKNKIKYVFNADSNFGIFERDLEIAQILVDTKKKYGYPEKFRSCFTKNAEERIFSIGKLLHENDMEKGVTLSFQSLNPKVLKNIHRDNIKLDVYKNLVGRFQEQNIPVYTELIVGLPGETYGSFRDGIDNIIASGFQGQLFCYFCEVYPNTELADPNYQRKHGIKTRKIRLTPTHSKFQEEEITEYQEIVVETKTMSSSSWMRSWVYAWLTMTLYSLKLCPDKKIDQITSFESHVIQSEILHYHKKLGSILLGGERCEYLPQFGDIWWDVEEASFLRISEHIDEFYDTIGGSVNRNKIPRIEDFKSKQEFAEQVVLRGRKSNKILK